LEFNVPFQHKYGYIRDERKPELTHESFTETDNTQTHTVQCLFDQTFFLQLFQVQQVPPLKTAPSHEASGPTSNAAFH